MKELERQSSDPLFWNDQKTAGAVLKRLEYLRNQTESVGRIERDVDDMGGFADSVVSAQDEAELERMIDACEKELVKMEILLLFSGPFDDHDAIVSIHGGAGGVDAQDWAEMLLRMYLRWCEQNGFSSSIIDESRGQEAGIKSVSVEIRGTNAYGKLRCEAGVHRLVRQSPFNAGNLRQTSFALVEVMPVLQDPSEMPINDADLRIDTYRSSGAGGQHVNKTESAIRITHIPSGLVATCQTERSQIQNRERAMTLLKAKLLQKTIEEREKEKKAIRGDHVSAQWGNQIRSYVLHPYQMIKDHRTGYETSDTPGFLEGGINEAIEACLRWNASRREGDR